MKRRRSRIRSTSRTSLDVDLILDLPCFLKQRGNLRFLVGVPLCKLLLLRLDVRSLRIQLRQRVALALERTVEVTDFVIELVVPILVEHRDLHRLLKLRGLVVAFKFDAD